MSTLFALPVSTSQQRQPWQHDREQHEKKKRKRGVLHKAEAGLDDTGRDEQDESTDNEDRAVVSPGERAQRYVANLKPNKPLPRPPFPHKDTTVRNPRGAHASTEGRGNGQSLRLQHVSAMTALLHKCLRNRDWPRARRALGLLMRTEISGQALDVRAGEYWGIGAEILFRHQPDPGKSWRRSGFLSAKEYYEKLIVRYPYHRASPESVNSIDFYLAMFSLWIYVVQAEREAATNAGASSLQAQEAQRNELYEAGQIKARLTKCMGTSPYADVKAFQQLQRDVHIWYTALEREYQAYSPVPNVELSAEEHLSVAAEQLNLHSSASYTHS